MDSGTGGNITNGTFRNMKCIKTEYGIRLKAKGKTQDGDQKYIQFINITFNEVGHAIDINEFNQSIDGEEIFDLEWVDISDILFQDIRGTYTQWAGHLDCDEDYPCNNLVFNNINLTAMGTTETWECSDNVYGTTSNVNPELKCLNNK